MTPATEPQLVVEGGPQDQETIDLQGPTITMGRQPDNDIFVSEAMVSRHHAEIVVTDAGCFLRDLYSSNGTLVNDRKIPEGDYALKDGDRIQLAASEVSFVFRSATAVTRQVTRLHGAVERTPPEPPATEGPTDTEEAASEPDEERLYEGTVHLLLMVEGGMGLVFNFTQQLREKPAFRLLRLNNNNAGGVDIWLGLREPVALEQALLEMEGIVEVSPNPDADEPSVTAVLREVAESSVTSGS